MATWTRTTRTLATALALGLVAPAAGMAHAADLPISTISVKAVQYPKLIDRPGANDTIRFTKVLNAVWRLDGTEVTFPTGTTTTELPVAAASQVTLEGGPATTRNTFAVAPSVPTTWNFDAPSTSTDGSTLPDVSQLFTWNDLPGAKDTFTIKRHPGVTWQVKVGTRPVVDMSAEAFGKKTEITYSALNTTVTPVVEAGYTPSTLTLPASTLTTAAIVQVPAADVKAAVSVGDNPLDATKGYGAGASVETVKITGIPGVAWRIGSSTRQYNVRPGTVSYIPAPGLGDGMNTVTVTAVPAAGYALETLTPVTLTFDDAAAKPIAITDDMVTFTEAAGTTDTLKLTSKGGMTWWIGQEVTNYAGTSVVYRAAKGDKQGNVNYTPRFERGATEAKVFLKPVPARGYVLDTSDWTEKQFTYSAAQTTVATSSAIDGAASTVTLMPKEGVSGWTVRYGTSIGAQPVNAAATVKAADLTTRGIASIVFPNALNATVTTKVDRGYKLP